MGNVEKVGCADGPAPSAVLPADPGRLRTIYLITPTYDRPQQLAELTRLSQTLLLERRLHWILVEDSANRTGQVIQFLSRVRALSGRLRAGLQLTHLHVQTPSRYRLKDGDPSWAKPKGVLQRNLGLQFLREQADRLDADGLLYFMDDDNTYDLRLFAEIRRTRRAAVWPVGLVGGLLVERPLLDAAGRTVVGFNARWKPQRKYPVDMAGFAVSLQALHRAGRVRFSNQLRIGYQETHFLDQILDSPAQLEPLANRCTDVLVWHTRTQTFRPMPPPKQNKL